MTPASLLPRPDAPSLDEWRRLHDAALRFRDLAPWSWMTDDQLFGVRNPEDGEIGWCCVMGQLGMHYGLGVYLGAEGLSTYLDLQSGEITEGSDEVVLLQKCLMASFEDRTRLGKHDLDVIRRLGLKLRGRNAWPQFQSFEPGYFPWHLDAPQCRFLTHALEQAMVVAGHVRQAPHLLEPHKKGTVLVRMAKPAVGAPEWVDAWLPLPPAFPPPAAPPPLDELLVHRLKQLPRDAGAIWEVDSLVTSSFLQERPSDRPAFLRATLVVDHASGFIHAADAQPAPALRAEFAARLLGHLGKVGFLPGRIWVVRDELVELLEPVAQALGVALELVEHLPALEPARDALREQF